MKYTDKQKIEPVPIKGITIEDIEIDNIGKDGYHFDYNLSAFKELTDGCYSMRFKNLGRSDKMSNNKVSSSTDIHIAKV